MQMTAMTKDEWILVAIRIFGVFLLVLAIIELLQAIGGVYGYWQISSAVGGSTSLAPVVEATQKAALAGGIKSIASIFIFLPFSYYFMRHAKWLHKLASA